MAAVVTRSVRINVNVSYENVEKVVKAPRKPIAIAATTRSDQPRSSPALSTKPSAKLPARLIDSVAHGNERVPTATPTPYRARPPTAAKPAINSAFTIRSSARQLGGRRGDAVEKLVVELVAEPRRRRHRHIAVADGDRVDDDVAPVEAGRGADVAGQCEAWQGGEGSVGGAPDAGLDHAA